MDPQLEKYIRSLALPAGTMLNEIEIRSIIGIGRTGIVYDAYDTIVHRELAVKEFIPAKLSIRKPNLEVVPASLEFEKEFTSHLRLFIDNGRRLTDLKHPNIVQLNKVEQHNGTAYLLMEKVDGPLLSSRIGGDNFFTPDKVREFINQILAALKHLHDNGIHHLALEPNNVILNRKHGPVLIDFGSAIHREDSYDIKDDPFRALELTNESSDQVDNYSDIYSAGALFSYLISGAPPIAASSRAIAKTDPQPHLASNPDLKKLHPFSLLSSIDTALALKPLSRFQSVTEWQERISDEAMRKEEKGRLIKRSIIFGSLALLAVWLFFGRDYFTEERMWSSLSAQQPCEAQKYLFDYPNGRHKEEAELRVQLCKTKQEQVAAQRKSQRIKQVSGLVGPMIRVNAGCFLMGSPISDPDRRETERQHQVCLKNAFEIAKFEVSVELFRQFINRERYKTDAERNKNKPGCWALDAKNQEEPWEYREWASWENPFQGHKIIGSYPVTCVSPNDVDRFLNWLNSLSSLKFRLPTEAEWEFAAKGLSSNIRPWGSDISKACEYANVADLTNDPAVTGNYTNSSPWPSFHNCVDGSIYTSPVGKYRPNLLGIHDMIGNAWEITCSQYSGAYGGLENSCARPGDDVQRTDKGGGWESFPGDARTAIRGTLGYFDRASNIGFRLVREISDLDQQLETKENEL